MQRISRRAGLQAGAFVLAMVGLVAGLMMLLNHTIAVPVPPRGATAPPPPTGNSKSRIAGFEPLTTILAPDTARHTGTPALTGCATSPDVVASLRLRGVEDSISCSGPASTKIRLSAYQFAKASEYTAGFARLAAAAGWRAPEAGSHCPPTSRTYTGRVPWQDPPVYPSHPGQVLDCAASPNAGSLDFIWGMPTQRVVFTAVNNGPGASYGSLWAWLKSVRFD